VGFNSREGDPWFDRQVSPSFLLITGLLLAPAIILQRDLTIKAVQTGLFFGLAVLSVSAGRRRLVIGSCIFIASTIIVNLFSPVGRVILRIGPLRITRGALTLGISKATTLASLLYVSRFCVRPSVRLPGVLGRTVSETFAFLSRLLARGERVSRHNLVQSLDEQFESIFDGEGRQPADFPAGGNTVIGLLVLASLLIVNWGALFFHFSALLAEP
jgi:hypothetical protein